MKELKLKLKAMEEVAASRAGAGMSEKEAQERVDAALAEAEAKAEEDMTELLECLGQEEEKVRRLRCLAWPLSPDPDVLQWNRPSCVLCEFVVPLICRMSD